MNAPTPAAPAASVLIVSGLKREAAILAGPGRLAICGDGPTLRARLAELANKRIALVISWGVCGGLDPRLHPGDLILGAEVVSAEGRIITDGAVTSSLAQRLIDAGARVAWGHELAWSRPPVPAEVERGITYVQVCTQELDKAGVPAERRDLEAWTSYARLLLTANEFLYLD